MADQAITKSTPMGDFLHHFESAGVCFETAPFKNSSGVDLVKFDPVGYPVKLVGANYEPALEADSAAGIDGWLLHDKYITLANGVTSDREVLVLARGPAVIIQETLPVNDAAGTPFTASNLLATLEAANIQTRNVPPKTSEQTT